MIKVAFIAEDPLYLRRLEEVIRLQPDMQCSIAVTSMEAFWSQIPARSSVDFVFLDVYLPGQSGIEAIPALRKRFHQAEIILLANCEDENALLRSLNAGATGYLNKEFSVLQLPQMIQTVLNGGALVSPRMVRKLMELIRPTPAAYEHLKPREAQLLHLFYEGHTYEETASIMGLSVDGVKYHAKNIYRKLKVDNKIDALRIYSIEMK